MLASATFLINGCSTVPDTNERKNVTKVEVEEAIQIFKDKDPSIETFFKNSYGYAVIPKVFKAAVGLGGAGGRGEVFEKGKMVGYCKMSQATIGFSLGGEFFREIIFFRTKEDLDKFKTGEFAFSAQATAVALSVGAAAKADYKDGTAVFAMTDAGLMFDASLGGQKFDYVRNSYDN